VAVDVAVSPVELESPSPALVESVVAIVVLPLPSADELLLSDVPLPSAAVSPALPASPELVSFVPPISPDS
jgi:hypothetical protein